MLRVLALWFALLSIVAVGCEKNGGRSTIRKVGDDVESEVHHAPGTLEHAGKDVDDSAHDLLGDKPKAPAAKKKLNAEPPAPPPPPPKQE